AEVEALHKTHDLHTSGTETTLLIVVSKELPAYLPQGTPIIDLGPGTINACKNKTLPIIQSVQSEVYIPVDESIAFLREIFKAKEVLPCSHIRPIVDNFFDSHGCYCEHSALVCSFGSTIGNIVNPISADLPSEALTRDLLKLSSAVKDGWMLVAFDSNQNSNEIKSYYSHHALFQMNIFDRMAVELPLEGFDPLAFEYSPEWTASSSQLAHIAVVTRDMSFTLAGARFSLLRGQKLHLKNSYKFTPLFFERCCRLAGIEIIKSWADNSPSKAYLLKLPPLRAALSYSSNESLFKHTTGPRAILAISKSRRSAA
ncbi:MAG: L-histidine N(alpha)-methyltransferase, partial [Alphaproteobacteria bacterium]|nr:L-histidine N(alpha)-methyltransferase [Alphaproteobacteria bacterium]